jgi:7-cyano-7-deazaguanine reductase
MTNFPEQSELGKKSAYDPHYNPDLLFPIPRQGKRDEIGVMGDLPFTGFDLWNHYEVSWLNEKGKPVVAVAEIVFPCESQNILESKSMKLYFNSLNNTKFRDLATVETMVIQDLSQRAGLPVTVRIVDLIDAHADQYHARMAGVCLDDLDVECSVYHVHPDYLTTTSTIVEETLFSNLLKSNCLVTHQPDWGSVQISYKGNKINHEGLLQYLVSFRNHNEFHEQCIERIFVDIMRQCQPESLSVYGRYTRRGGLDINVLRATRDVAIQVSNERLIRQ